MQNVDVFSANSLKILDKSLEEFKNKYVYNLSLFKKDKRADSGKKFHSLICAYIKGFDVSKLLYDLNDDELKHWSGFEKLLNPLKNGFIKTEYSFLIKDALNDKSYCLTGRFDAVYKDDNGYVIYDWKTLNLPKDPYNDLQSVVYLYCAKKIFNTEEIQMKYLSIEKKDFVAVKFASESDYKKRLDEIIQKVL